MKKRFPILHAATTSFYAAATLTLTLSSCSLTGDNSLPTHLAFQEERNSSRWGLIGLDGKVLYADEFKNRPTAVIDGMFSVKDNKGKVNYYRADDKMPQRVGGDYESGGLFLAGAGLAPVVKEGEYIKYINKEGETVLNLGPDNDLGVKDEIVCATSFYDGMAAFYTNKETFGFINSDGKVVIEPKFAKLHAPFTDGVAIVTTLEELEKKAAGEDYQIAYIDRSGKILMQLPSESLRYATLSEGMYAFCEKDDNGYYWGFKDIDGEKVIKPQKKFKQVRAFNHGIAAFYDGEGWGLIDKKGEIVARAKYDEINYYDDAVMIASKNGETKLYNLAGEQIGKDEYKEIMPFIGKSSTTFALDGDEYLLIDKEGQEKDAGEWYKVHSADDDMSISHNAVWSDYADFDAALSAINLTADGVASVTLETKPEEAYNTFGLTNTEHKSRLNNSVGASFTQYKTDFSIACVYNGKVLDDTGAFTSEKPTGIFLLIAPDKTQTDLSGKVWEKLKALGQPLPETGSYKQIKTSAGSYITVAFTGNTATIYWSKTSDVGGYTSQEEDSCATSDDYYTPTEEISSSQTATAPAGDNFAWLSERAATTADINGMPKDRIRILRNAIFARHGYIFKDKQLSNYFSGFSWYKPRYTDVSRLLSTIEQQNIAFLKSHE